MANSQYTTIGRNIYPGFEVKLFCEMNVTSLNNECMNERYRIVYIKEGYGIFRNGNNSQIVTSPSILCINEKDIVELYDTADILLDIMYFEPTCFERYVTFESLELWKNSLNHDTWFFRAFFERTDSYLGACSTNFYLGKRMSQLIAMTDDLLTKQEDDFWPCRSRSYFLELLLMVNHIYSENEAHDNLILGKSNDEIDEVLSWLHIHYPEKITMETLTKQFHTNKTTLNQRFKASMGMTVIEYINNLRMQTACSLLKKTYLSVGEIMERSGYRDEAHFSRAFKKHSGCTPSVYRNQFPGYIHVGS